MRRAIILRRFPLTGEIGALIIEKDHFNMPLVMLTFKPDGSICQTNVDYATTIMSTVPCQEEEYLPLLQALEESDYKVRIINKRLKR